MAIDLLEIEPFGEGANAVLRNFGVLREEFEEPPSSPARSATARRGSGTGWRSRLRRNLGTLSTMPPEGYRPSHAGPYGGDFDQRDVGAGARVHLPVMVDDALIFMADPHAAISDGIISGTGVECSARVRARISLNKESPVERPIFEQNGTVQIVGYGPSVEAATEDASNAAVGLVAGWTGLTRREAYMLLGIVGELRIGTSPRPTMAARLIVEKAVLASAGWDGAVVPPA